MYKYKLRIMKSINDIEHVTYINLEHRTDRKKEVENELQSIGLLHMANRFNAIKTKDGRIGCTLSHLKCLEEARDKKYSHLMIVEDDIQFLKPTIFTEQLDKFLGSGIKWDVILLAGNNLPPHFQVHESAVKVTQCQTTTGYIIQQHYYDTLINNIRDGIQMLMKNPTQHVYYAIDKFWIQLQKIHNWFLITPLTVTQRDGFSDIEGRKTNYTRAMVDLEKTQFLRRAQVIQRQLNSPVMNSKN